MRAVDLKAMAEIYKQSLDPNIYSQHNIKAVVATLNNIACEEQQYRKIEGQIQRTGFRKQADATDIDCNTPRNLDHWLSLYINFKTDQTDETNTAKILF